MEPKTLFSTGCAFSETSRPRLLATFFIGFNSSVSGSLTNMNKIARSIPTIGGGAIAQYEKLTGSSYRVSRRR